MEVRSGQATSGDLKLYYEDMGDVDDPPVLLIMGLGAQLLLWRKPFCEKLVDEGLRVIRYDNRDVGLSDKTEHKSSGQSLAGRLLRFWVGVANNSAYTLEDMADDAAAVLDHLGIERAHIVGASMGGMIAQVFAARFAERTKSLAVIFSSNNQAFLPPPAPRALLAVLKGPPPGSPRDVDHRQCRAGDEDHRQSGLPTDGGMDPHRRRRELRPQLLPARRRPALQRDPGQRQSAGL